MTVLDDTEPEWMTEARTSAHASLAAGALPYELTEREQTALTAHATNGDDLLFRRWTMDELIPLAKELPSWVIRGLLIDPTYGQIAGEMKTLKSYFAAMVMVAVASGEPLLGHFHVDRPGPVLAYIGEGGRNPWMRRLIRVAEAMHVNLADIPIVPTFDVAPIGSLRFTESLRRDLDDINPALFILDPLYAYHGTGSDARNLHEEGSLLSSISAPCIDTGTSLLIVNHFNQTGSGGGLKRITQAGSGEWVDTWILTGHREPPDVNKGLFHLSLEIGSRQWGGTAWDLELDIGRFNPETGTHDGTITWQLGTHTATAESDREQTAIDAVTDYPFQLIREEIAKRIGGNLVKARTLVDTLEHRGAIHTKRVTRADKAGRARVVWAYAPGPRPDDAPDTTSDPGRQQTTNGQENA